jgi:hypothetical protein
MLKYTLSCLPALAILLMPMGLVIIQMQVRYGYESPRPNEAVIIRITFAEPLSLESMEAHLEVPDGIVVETPALRIVERKEIDFRISAKCAGVYNLAVRTKNDHVTKALCVGKCGVAISRIRSRDLLDRLLCPAEYGMQDKALHSIEVLYPRKTIHILLWDLHWTWLFLVVLILVGISTRRGLKVEL